MEVQKQGVSLTEKFNVNDLPDVKGVANWLDSIAEEDVTALLSKVTTLEKNIKDIISTVPEFKSNIELDIGEVLKDTSSLVKAVKELNASLAKPKGTANSYQNTYKDWPETDYYGTPYHGTPYYDIDWESAYDAEFAYDYATYNKGRAMYGKKYLTKKDHLGSTKNNSNISTGNTNADSTNITTTTTDEGIMIRGKKYYEYPLNLVMTADILKYADIVIDEKLLPYDEVLENITTIVNSSFYSTSENDLNTISKTLTDTVFKLNKEKGLLALLLSKYLAIDVNILAILSSSSKIWEKHSKDVLVSEGVNKCYFCKHSAEEPYSTKLQEVLAAQVQEFFLNYKNSENQNLFTLYICPYCGATSIMLLDADKPDVLTNISESVASVGGIESNLVNTLIDELLDYNVEDTHCVVFNSEDITADALANFDMCYAGLRTSIDVSLISDEDLEYILDETIGQLLNIAIETALV